MMHRNAGSSLIRRSWAWCPDWTPGAHDRFKPVHQPDGHIILGWGKHGTYPLLCSIQLGLAHEGIEARRAFYDAVWAPDLARLVSQPLLNID